MPTAIQPSDQFRDEIRIIPSWAYVLAALGYVGFAFLFFVIVPRQHDAPPLAVRSLLFLLGGTVLGCLLLLIGYVNRDSARRGMSSVLWTLIAIFVPNGLGILLYFVLRKPRPICCQQCNSTLGVDFSFCPHCRFHLKPACPQCQRGVNLGDKFCPYCGAALNAPGLAPSVAAPSA